MVGGVCLEPGQEVLVAGSRDPHQVFPGGGFIESDPAPSLDALHRVGADVRAPGGETFKRLAHMPGG